jgi:hypothetical protein
MSPNAVEERDPESQRPEEVKGSKISELVLMPRRLGHPKLGGVAEYEHVAAVLHLARTLNVLLSNPSKRGKCKSKNHQKKGSFPPKVQLPDLQASMQYFQAHDRINQDSDVPPTNSQYMAAVMGQCCVELVTIPVLRMVTSICMSAIYLLRSLPMLHEAHRMKCKQWLPNYATATSPPAPQCSSAAVEFSPDWKMRLAVCTLLGTLLSEEEYTNIILQQNNLNSRTKHLATDVQLFPPSISETTKEWLVTLEMVPTRLDILAHWCGGLQVLSAAMGQSSYKWGVSVNCIFEDFFVILKPKLPHELLSGVKTCVTFERKQKVKKGHQCFMLVTRSTSSLFIKREKMSVSSRKGDLFNV